MRTQWSDTIDDLCVQAEEMLKDLPSPATNSREEFFAPAHL